MMNLKKYKNILKIILVVVCTFSFTVTVNAANDGKIDCAGTYIKEGSPNASKIKRNFGIKIEKDGNKYTISVNPSNSLNSKTVAKMKKVKFSVVSTDPPTNQTGKTVQAGSPLTLTINGKSYDDNYGEGVIVRLHASFTDNGADLCSGKNSFNVDFYLFSPELQGAVVTTVDVAITPADLADDSGIPNGEEIKCNNYDNYKVSDPFKYYFCLAKDKATSHAKFNSSTDEEKGNTMVNFEGLFDGDKKYNDVTNKTRKFKCNTKVSQTYEQATNGMTEEYTPDNYYKDNTKYLYGSGEKTVNKGKYQYHFWNSNPTKIGDIQCKVKCEEAVIAKYGPPVASKAGSCFDYRIEVESRVNCWMTEEPTPPAVYKEVCSPTPLCNETWNQGGPSEEFDSCIQGCDGGDYSDKCNKECYKEVYGDKSNVKNTNVELSYEIKKISDSSFDYEGISRAGNAAWNSNVHGYYIYNGGMHWYPGGNRGRWYFHHSWGLPGYDYSQRTEGGIPRALDCTDSCVWLSDCGEHQYLNYGLSEKDKELNLAKYKEAKKECKAMSKCSSSTAQYTISANYKKFDKIENGKEKYEVVTINFPYTSEGHKDKISTCNENGTKYRTYENKDTTILKYAGCYKGCESDRYYMTEWTFPGAWINKKSGEISFEDKSGDSAWRSKPKRFCIPSDAGEVNKKWGAWYYTKIAKISNDELCICEEVTDAYRDSLPEDYNSNDYNIRGKAINFGYYLWDIDFRCFYSVINTGPTETDTESTTNPGVCPGSNKCGKTTEYRVRTVSNTELFPSSTGTTTSTGTTQGRVAGYNWTEKATLTTDKVNANYANNPEKVLNYIQSLGDSVYSDSSYVDYEFELTPSDLKAIRAYNKGKDFGVFCGSVDDAQGVYFKDGEITLYNSNLFRQGVDTRTWADKCANANSNFINAKKLGVIGCNNDAGNTCKTDF